MPLESILSIVNTSLLLILTIAVVAGVVSGAALRSSVTRVLDGAESSMVNVKRTLSEVEALTSELRSSGIIDRVKVTLGSAQGAMQKLDPLAGDLQQTITEARELLDDATQTSQSVRSRVDDLAAMQRELTALSKSLADIAGELKDRDVSGKLANVLADTSLLAADIGILAENANSYLEDGKPMMDNIGEVVSSAKDRVSGISNTIGSLREGIKAGVKEFAKPESEG